MKMVELTCEICGQTFLRNVSEVKRNQRLGRHAYCSRKCTGIANIPNLPDEWPTDHLPKGSSPDEFSPFREYFKLIKRRTGERKETLQITLEDLKQQWESQEGICPLTGWSLEIPPTTNWSAHPITPKRASIDRIDSNIGYIPGNIRYVSVIANYCKNNFIDKDVIEFCRAVVAYQTRQNEDAPQDE